MDKNNSSISIDTDATNILVEDYESKLEVLNVIDRICKVNHFKDSSVTELRLVHQYTENAVKEIDNLLHFMKESKGKDGDSKSAENTVYYETTSSTTTNWDVLAGHISNGVENTGLKIGDKFRFKLKDGMDASVSVAAINPYGKNTVAFAFDDLLWQEKMNERDTNRGGWAHSKMADILENEILPLLPDELVDVIQPRTIVQNISGTRYERTSKLWLPSRTEMFGEHESYKECDFGDIHFPLFKTEKSRVKALEDGTTEWYWLRSPTVGNSTNFWYVSNYGDSSYYDASNVFGVCPCFIIGKSDEENTEETFEEILRQPNRLIYGSAI